MVRSLSHLLGANQTRSLPIVVKMPKRTETKAVPRIVWKKRINSTPDTAAPHTKSSKKVFPDDSSKNNSHAPN